MSNDIFFGNKRSSVLCFASDSIQILTAVIYQTNKRTLSVKEREPCFKRVNLENKEVLFVARTAICIKSKHACLVRVCVYLSIGT